MLGFLPGFAYLGIVDEAIAVPRHATPRCVCRRVGRDRRTADRRLSARVAGGWQIIGRTPVSLFDAHRSPAALLAPGDTVRFRAGQDRTTAVPAVSRTAVRAG